MDPQANGATYSPEEGQSNSPRSSPEDISPVPPNFTMSPQPSNMMMNQQNMPFIFGPFTSSPFSSGPNMPNNLPMPPNWSPFFNQENMPPIPPFPMLPFGGYPFHPSMAQMAPSMTPYHPYRRIVFPPPPKRASPRISSATTPPNNYPKPKKRANITLTNRPNYAKGSLIQLPNGSIKRVEDMTTQDFVLCAKLTPDAKLNRSKVAEFKACENNDYNNQNDDLVLRPESILIVFHVNGRYKIVVEAPTEFPFFVFDHGWSAYSPQRCKKVYSLEVRELAMGDECISL